RPADDPAVRDASRTAEPSRALQWLAGGPGAPRGTGGLPRGGAPLRARRAGPRVMPEIFQQDYFQRAMMAAALVGLLCPMVGVFLVLRRLSLIGDGLGHISFAGLAFGWLAGIYPLLSAAMFALVGALGLETLRARRREYG